MRGVLTPAVLYRTKLMLSKHELDAEGTDYVSLVIYAVVYGIYIVVFCLTIQAFLSNPNILKTKKRFHIAFSGVIMMLNTLTFFSDVWLLLDTWIVHRNDPGGPLAYHNSNVKKIWYEKLGNISHLLLIVLTDTLYIHRFYVIFGSRKAVFTLIPFHLAVIGLACLYVTALQFHDSAKADLYASLVIASTTVLNILLTVAICVRLHMIRREVLSGGSASLLTGITAILVESTAPLTIVGTMSSILSAVDSPFSSAIECLWLAMTVLCPQLITLRIALGTAWSREPTVVWTSTV